MTPSATQATTTSATTTCSTTSVTQLTWYPDQASSPISVRHSIRSAGGWFSLCCCSFCPPTAGNTTPRFWNPCCAANRRRTVVETGRCACVAAATISSSVLLSSLCSSVLDLETYDSYSAGFDTLRFDSEGPRAVQRSGGVGVVGMSVSGLRRESR